MNRHGQRFSPTEHVRTRKGYTRTICYWLSFISNVLQIEIEGRQGPSLYREEYILQPPMPTHTLSVDTSVLPTGVLSIYDVQFYDLVERIAGVAVATLLEIQGIRSVYSFLNTDDVFEILSVPCATLNHVRKLVCLEKMDKTFTVMPGCRSGIRYLSQLLSRRHEEHMKEIGAQSNRNKQRPARSIPASIAHLSQDSPEILSSSSVEQHHPSPG